jgi:hypothetical protein
MHDRTTSIAATDAPTRVAEAEVSVQRLMAGSLDERLVEALYRFHSRSVERSRESFVKGLLASDEVWVLRADDAIHGFATLNTLTHEIDGEAHTVIYTRWAFVERSMRRKGFIHRVGVNAWLRQKARHPLRPVHWVFTASSIDSYVHMLRSAPLAFPSRHAPTPDLLSRLLDRTMVALGTEGWDPAAGVVRRSGEVCYLEGRTARDESDADALFYRSRNPRQDRGDSLGCIAPATGRALVKYTGRLVRGLRAR